MRYKPAKVNNIQKTELSNLAIDPNKPVGKWWPIKHRMEGAASMTVVELSDAMSLFHKSERQGWNIHSPVQTWCQIDVPIQCLPNVAITESDLQPIGFTSSDIKR